MEIMVNWMFGGCFHNKKVLVTGNTGFKGSWLTLWLKHLGADVTGYSLAPDTHPSHWETLHLDCASYTADIRDAQKLESVFKEVSPDIVFHLAAQPLVRLSYQEPLDTWSTNVLGTANVLNACRGLSNLTGVVVVTTDKVYENTEHGLPFSEEQRLGGADPYSASKAACELVVQSFRKSFFQSDGPLVASVRAGNVIGGGDWARDRLIPDIVKASNDQSPLKVRYPDAVRPWQHVLDSISGYLCLGQSMLSRDTVCEGAWNFGPNTEQIVSVGEMLKAMNVYWPELKWEVQENASLPESKLLRLNSDKAKRKLGWQPIWELSKTVEHTAKWYQQFYASNTLASKEQLIEYCDDAIVKGVHWTCN
ncbi:MAG: CDP-glucose 4,6-dehydratase [Alteromonas sp.]|nr:CDP-glucose 4,6-dehydratase [Alteromonas sp.]